MYAFSDEILEDGTLILSGLMTGKITYYISIKPVYLNHLTSHVIIVNTLMKPFLLFAFLKLVTVQKKNLVVKNFRANLANR